MLLVPKEQFHLLKEKMMDAPTFVYSVLDQMIDGAVYTHSVKEETILVKTNAGLYYITGKPCETAWHQLRNMYEQALHEQKRFTLFCDDSLLETELDRRFCHQLTKVRRYTFSFQAGYHENGKRPLKQSYDVKRINQPLIEQSVEFTKQYYMAYWDTVENFLTHGIGFCIMDNEKVVSEAVSIFRSQAYAEIDIFTHANYRGQGLAKIIGERFIDDCIAHKLEPRWDCDVNNVASIYLGTTLGFTNRKAYSVYTKTSKESMS